MSKGWTSNYNYKNRCSEIVPKEDDKDHISGPFCECNPRIDHLPGGHTVIAHHSFDGREAIEWANKIINH